MRMRFSAKIMMLGIRSGVRQSFQARVQNFPRQVAVRSYLNGDDHSTCSVALVDGWSRRLSARFHPYF